jgi:DNA polymerase elongation subunit (family B)
MEKRKILFYDIETTPLKAYVWRLGEQVVRHSQLMSDGMLSDIICIAYCWNDGKRAKVLDWGYEEQNSEPMLAEFDEIIKSADVVVGKNSDRFDNKHINTHRLLSDRPGMPDWTKYTDDLEKQLRKHFALPSYSLDYVSNLLGLGGKTKMEFSDWVDIVEQRNESSFNKMLRYNKKDVEDTRAIWEYCEKHFTPKMEYVNKGGPHVCPTCGSDKLTKAGVKYSLRSAYQTYFCKGHNGYGGRQLINHRGGQ